MADLTTAANAIKTIVDETVVRGIFTNDELRSIFPSKASRGGTTKNWHLLTSGVAGQATQDGASYAAVDSNAYQRATLSYRLYDATIGISSGLRAALLNNLASYFDAIVRETQEAINGVNDAAATQWLGASVEGLLLAIDSTGTYAGQSHSGVTGWNSYEDTTAAALSHAMLDDMRENLRTTERRGRPNLILSAENQISNYTRLSGPGQRQSFVTQTMPGVQPQSDIGENRDNAGFGGMPWIGLADLDASTILMLPRECIEITNHERTAGDGGWETVDVPPGGHTQQVNVSYYGLISCLDPFRCGKLSGVTA